MEEFRILRPKAYIRLQGKTSLERRAEWLQWKKLGYRVAEPDGITILHEKEAIRRRVLGAFNNIDADVFLFGSQVDGTAGPCSDHDVGYDADEPVAGTLLADLKHELEELPIPAKVDLVNFGGAQKEFVHQALRKVEVWKKKRLNSLFS
ncbi:MAG: nucleotidyltransferase domain-containing protein [Bacillota bacterium]